jgi:hypothetical protein
MLYNATKRQMVLGILTKVHFFLLFFNFCLMYFLIFMPDLAKVRRFDGCFTGF